MLLVGWNQVKSHPEGGKVGRVEENRSNDEATSLICTVDRSGQREGRQSFGGKT
jgi:hypothetical protein